jgi:hypothetical protein
VPFVGGKPKRLPDLAPEFVVRSVLLAISKAAVDCSSSISAGSTHHETKPFAIASFHNDFYLADFWPVSCSASTHALNLSTCVPSLLFVSFEGPHL